MGHTRLNSERILVELISLTMGSSTRMMLFRNSWRALLGSAINRLTSEFTLHLPGHTKLRSTDGGIRSTEHPIVQQQTSSIRIAKFFDTVQKNKQISDVLIGSSLAATTLENTHRPMQTRPWSCRICLTCSGRHPGRPAAPGERHGHADLRVRGADRRLHQCSLATTGQE